MGLLRTCEHCGTRVLPTIAGTCPHCRKQIAESAPKVEATVSNSTSIGNEAAQPLKRHAEPSVGPLGGSWELHEYVSRAPGISRTVLNFLCIAGLFFPPAVWVIYDKLGKGWVGWLYLVGLLAGIATTAATTPILGIAVFALYVGNFVHANAILSRYKSNALSRIWQIDEGLKHGETANAFLERGLLTSKVLWDDSKAIEDIEKVVDLPGGDQQFLSIAGDLMVWAKRFSVAKVLLERARADIHDKKRLAPIDRNLKYVRKRIKKA